MSKLNLAIVGVLFIAVSLSCKWLPTRTTKTNKGPAIDFTSPGKGLDVKVQLDKKHAVSGNISPDGGTLSLTSADGSKFTLEVPPKALDTETTITMTALKSMDGAPLDNNKPAAVQLEPSGLFFNEMLTLTIVPVQEIPIKQQVIFGYEGDGKDYHLALVDPKSRDIKIKLMEFSGAGVGSGGDAAWAINLQIQAETARTRLQQKNGELAQRERERTVFMGEEASDWLEKAAATIGQYEDQVLRKEMVAAELDCRLAYRATQNYLGAERQKGLIGVKQDPNFWQVLKKFEKLIKECKKPAAFQIVGGLDDWHTNTKVCDIMKPFKLTGSGIVMNLSGGLVGTYEYGGGPFGAQGNGTYTISLPGGLDKPGSMTGSGEGSAGGASNSGTEKYTLTPIPPCEESETK